jgi:hypothetical protein
LQAIFAENAKKSLNNEMPDPELLEARKKQEKRYNGPVCNNCLKNLS